MEPSRGPPARGRLTILLETAAAGKGGALDELIALVYTELLQISAAFLAGERRSHTLQPTDLVNEAYLRLSGDLKAGTLKNSAQFFHAAGRAMERILIEYARKRGRLKRGGDWRRTTLNAVQLAVSQNPGKFLDLHEAIRRLEGWDPALGDLVRLRYYAGLEIEEAAGILGVSPSTVKRGWRFARAWLYNALKEGGRG